MEKFRDVFAYHEKPMKGEKFHITLSQDTRPIQVTNCRKFPHAWKPRLEKKLAEFETKGRISKVTYPTKWVNPMVVAENPSYPEELRIMGDYRTLNSTVLANIMSPARR